MERGSGGAVLAGILRGALRRLRGPRADPRGAHGEGRPCPSCGHLMPAEAAQCGACRAFLTPWIRDADGRWLESDGKGGWRPASPPGGDGTDPGR